MAHIGEQNILNFCIADTYKKNGLPDSDTHSQSRGGLCSHLIPNRKLTDLPEESILNILRFSDEETLSNIRQTGNKKLTRIAHDRTLYPHIKLNGTIYQMRDAYQLVIDKHDLADRVLVEIMKTTENNDLHMLVQRTDTIFIKTNLTPTEWHVVVISLWSFIDDSCKFFFDMNCPLNCPMDSHCAEDDTTAMDDATTMIYKKLIDSKINSTIGVMFPGVYDPIVYTPGNINCVKPYDLIYYLQEDFWDDIVDRFTRVFNILYLTDTPTGKQVGTKIHQLFELLIMLSINEEICARIKTKLDDKRKYQFKIDFGYIGDKSLSESSLMDTTNPWLQQYKRLF